MRFVPVLLALALIQACFAQNGTTPTPSASSNLVLPDVTVDVHKHPVGADMVEITMRAPGYPADLLKKQIAAIGENLHSEPRGVEVHVEELSPGDPSMRFTKASFAADGIIDRDRGGYKIGEIVKAFAGAPKPWTVNGMEIEFQGEKPNGNNTLQTWRSKSVVCEGRTEGANDPRLTGVEYRIKLLTQDASKIDIPEPGQKPAKASEKPIRDNGVDWTIIIVFVAAAGAVGALVYSLLLRVRPKNLK